MIKEENLEAGYAQTRKPIWRIEDVAKHFDVTTRTVRDWMSSRKIPYFKIGARTVRFEPGEIRATLAKYRRDAI